MHTMPKRIYYHDTDCGGVVYYANYLKYFEEARTEYLRDKGLDIKELADSGTLFVVHKVDITYKFPARYADSLAVTTEISQAKSVSLIFSQQIKKGEQVLVSCRTQLVCVNRDFQPTIIPEEFTGNLE